MTFWWIILGCYILMNTLISLNVYYKIKKFYDPAFSNDDTINLHEKYEEFRKTDSLSFFRILIGINLFFWIKATVMLTSCVLLIVVLA
jgi:hypothetical protein